MEPKRLYRSETNKVFAGICGGVGEYFNLDPVLVRLGWMVILISTGVLPGMLVYIVAMMVVPRRVVHPHQA